MRREGFIAPKIFDILASGGFCISDKNPGIEEIFGDTVPQYESPEHLKELVDFYVGNPDERLKLMERGRKIALSYTWKRVAEQFVRAIEDLGLRKIDMWSDIRPVRKGQTEVMLSIRSLPATFPKS